MAFDFSNPDWGSVIAGVSELPEFQNCSIRITHDSGVVSAYDYRTDQEFTTPKLISEIAATGDDDELLAALGLMGSDVFRQNTGVPVGVMDSVWVRVIDRVYLVFRYDNGWQELPASTEQYEGQARFIPVRAGVWQGGEAQLNATTLRAVRFQVPFADLPGRVYSGSIVTFLSAPRNPNLVGRTAKVMDDFQGSMTASRTFHGMMDADSEDV